MAAVAHAQCQRVRVVEEGGELVAQGRVEQDGFRPAFARAEYVAVAEAAARRQHFEVGKVDAACHQVGHMHVVGIESGAGEGGGHFDLPVHTLFAQDGDFGFRATVDKRRGDVFVHVEFQVGKQCAAVVVANQCELAVGAGRIVAQALDGVAGFLPCALQVGAGLFQHDACLIADNDFFVRTDGGNGMQGQRCRFKQGFYCRNILFGDLNHCAQFFIEQCADAGFVDVGLVGNQ